MAQLVARDILASTHALHGAFVKWVEAKDNECAQPNLRQARKFLRAHPHYFVEKVVKAA